MGSLGPFAVVEEAYDGVGGADPERAERDASLSATDLPNIARG